MKFLILSVMILTVSSMAFADGDLDETIGLSIEIKSTDGHPTAQVDNLDYTQANHPLPTIMGKKIKKVEDIELRGPTSNDESGI